MTFAFLPGVDAVRLGVKLARGEDISWADVLCAGLDVAGPAAKIAGKFAGALASYKLGKKTLNGLKRIGHGLPTRAFNILDWAGYPGAVPRPKGPFTLLEGETYRAAREAADRAVHTFRKANNVPAGKEVHHIHPVKFGGSPTDPANLMIVDRNTHYTLNAFWARHQRYASPS